MNLSILVQWEKLRTFCKMLFVGFSVADCRIQFLSFLLFKILKSTSEIPAKAMNEGTRERELHFWVFLPLLMVQGLSTIAVKFNGWVGFLEEFPP